MLNRELDDEASILREIQAIESELGSLSDRMYELSMERKFLNHRLADLRYKQSQILNGIKDGV